MPKPRLIVHGQVSVDGRLTLAPGVLLLHGDRRWEAVAGPPADDPADDPYARLMAEHAPGAILEGSGSFVRDEQTPEPLPPAEGDPAALYTDYLPAEVLGRPDLRGWFTVVDGRGRIRWMYKEWPDPAWAGWLLLVLVHRATPAAYLAYLRREQIPYLVAGEKRVDLALALSKLNETLGVATVVCTSPGRLGGALLREGLIDELSLSLCPALIGGRDTPSLFDGPALAPDEWPTRLRLLHCEADEGGAVWLRYAVEGKGE